MGAGQGSTGRGRDRRLHSSKSRLSPPGSIHAFYIVQPIIYSLYNSEVHVFVYLRCIINTNNNN